ncbi:MAG TPA: CocE/NonD family hydrolase [Acidimicrobiales bacterium]|nr:CocE/NonD family hydrolase [Acidimicrobiales bacterium]
MKRVARIGATLLALTAALVLPSAGARATVAVTNAVPPADYTTTANLSQPTHTSIVRTVHDVVGYDGTKLYVEVVRPAALGRYPVILEASPYHGTLADRDGTRILPEPRDADGRSLGLTGYFAPRGYAVVMMDLRGTGRSQGCLDHLGPKDASDLKTVVEWASVQDWSNGRVGMTGHSYVGSTPSVAAAQNPKGLTTIVPSAGLASMYDHQFQAGVPYFLQWAGPIEAYEQLALERKMPPLPPDPFGLGLVHTGDDFGDDMTETGCGLVNSAAVAGEDQLSGRYADWHLVRDHDAGATDWEGPVFLVHGVNDNAARVSSMQWFTDRGGRPGDKLWLGQWDHGSGCCPTRRGIQWTYVLHAWFDKHLAGRAVETGPPVELFLSDGTFAEARAGDREEIVTSTAWPGQPRMLSFHPDANNGSLGTATPTAAGSATFAGDPSLYLEENGQGGLAFSTAALGDDIVIAGVPTLRLSAAVSVPRVHLIANLYDEAPGGNRRRITQCAINPELRNGIATRTLVTPGERYDLTPPCFAMAHHLREGHRLVLRVSTADPDKVPLFAIDPQVSVFTGSDATRVDVPVVDNPALFPDDVPLSETEFTGPPMASFDRDLTTQSFGAPVRIPGVTSQYIEFTIPDNSDTARGQVTATVALPADIDLYLQRRVGPDAWSGDIAVGGSSSLSGETMNIDRRLEPGATYRIEVHNWAGLPGNAVRVRAEFYRSSVPEGT